MPIHDTPSHHYDSRARTATLHLILAEVASEGTEGRDPTLLFPLVASSSGHDRPCRPQIVVEDTMG